MTGIFMAATRANALAAVEGFIATYGARYPNAVEKPERQPNKKMNGKVFMV